MTPGASGALRLSVVIPTRDGAATLADQVRAVLGGADGVDLDVVVVDNRSTDGTADLVRSMACTDPRIRLVPAEDRDGVCYARNVGVRAARHEEIAICDADDRVGSGWAAVHAAALARHAFVTGPLEVDLLNEPWAAGSRGRASTFLERPLFGGVLPFAHGCNVGVTRTAWEAAGGFDEDIFSGDIDFGLRMLRAGYELHFEPAALVHYRYRPTVAAMARQSYAYGGSWPLVCGRLRAAGLPVPGRFEGLRRGVWLVRNVPLLRRRAGRARWVWVAANEAGRVRGSLRERSVQL